MLRNLWLLPSLPAYLQWGNCQHVECSVLNCLHSLFQHLSGCTLRKYETKCCHTYWLLLHECFIVTGKVISTLRVHIICRRNRSRFYSLRFFTTKIPHNQLPNLRPIVFHTLWTCSFGYRGEKKIPKAIAENKGCSYLAWNLNILSVQNPKGKTL